MTNYTQESRRCGIETSLGSDTLLLTAFEGRESMSGLFQFTLNLLSTKDSIEASSLIGTPVGFWVERANGERRFFHGIVSRFEYIGRNDRLSVYRARVVPSLWFLSLNSDCRIFQQMTVPEIITEVLQRRGLTSFDISDVTATYPTLEYCVQYNESDFAFISRLMEQVGIFYFFRHSNDGHQLIIGDSNSACSAADDGEVRFTDNLSERSQTNEIWNWRHTYEFRPGRWSHKDFNFKAPQPMSASTKTLVSLQGNSAVEVYEYPGGFEIGDEGDVRARIRMEAEEARHDIVEGTSYCRAFSPGFTFRMLGHHSQRESNREYLLTAVYHRMDESGTYISGSIGALDGYENEFTCIPVATKYRPDRETQRPRIYGTQTAMVVGPSGEEIYTDEFGRVKVQFHWDREGKYDENSSCWLRVSQVHAGAGWGMMDLPRIGEEVIVSFLEGDPDRPLIVGRVYNGVNQVPFSLPAEKTRRGNSTKTYKGAGYNEMSMDDTPGKEQLRVNAMYNMNSNVNNDQTLDVGNNQTERVAVDRTREVGNNESITIGVTKDVKVGTSHSETIGVSQSTSVGSTQSNSVGSMKNETVGMMSNEMVGVAKTLNVGAAYSIIAGVKMSTEVGGSSTENVNATKSVTVGDEISIVCGSSKLVMKKDGSILLEGKDIVIKGSGKITAKAGGDMVLKAAKIGQN